MRDGRTPARHPDVAARRILTMIDGLGAQMVVRAVAPAELKHIAGSYVAAGLHLNRRD